MTTIDVLVEQNRSLEAQLVALYAEKQEHGDPVLLSEQLRSFELQLAALYHEKESQPGDFETLADSLKSMEDQLVALYEERAAFQERLQSIDRKVEEMKMKSKAIGAALLEAAIFGEDKKAA